LFDVLVAFRICSVLTAKFILLKQCVSSFVIALVQWEMLSNIVYENYNV